MKNLILQIRWLFASYRWEVFFNLGNNQFGVRKLTFLGKIKGFDWSGYKAKTSNSLYCTREQLEKLQAEIKNMLESNELKVRAKWKQEYWGKA